MEDLFKMEKIQPIKSPYGASFSFVKEKDKFRGVFGYIAVNRISTKNNTSLPMYDEKFDRLGKSSVFSKLDLKTVFHQIRVKPECVEKTAFNMKYGQYEDSVMPMGLCNAPIPFHTLMNTIFHDFVDIFMVLYIDYLLVFSKDEASHHISRFHRQR